MELSDFPEVVLPTHKLPASISLIRGFPKQLFIKGALEAITHPLIAVVGTRNPSTYGLKSSAYFSREFTLRGLGIVSGLAVGIDAAAHRACLRENGITVAVVAHGLDEIYPAIHRELAQQILAQGGALVSEFPAESRPRPFHFPLRNRIISALSIATLIIEASQQSGSLITARCAADQGRDVWVVPGPFDSPSFEGSHSLIRDGAKLVSSVDDCLIDISQTTLPIRVLPRQATAWDQEGKWKNFFQKLGDKATLAELADISGLSIADILEAMRAAERLGRVENTAPQTWIWLK